MLISNTLQKEEAQIVSMCVSKHNSNEHAERSYEKVRRPSYFAKATVPLYALERQQNQTTTFPRRDKLSNTVRTFFRGLWPV